MLVCKSHGPIVLVILLCLVSIPSRSQVSKPLSQQIYEEMKKTQCLQATPAELKALDCQCTLPPQDDKKNNLQAMDDLAEKIVFSDMAKRESQQLSCLENETQLILKYSDIKQQALYQTCGLLSLLTDSLDNEDFYRREVKSYETAMDPTLRSRPIEQIELARLQAKLGDVKRGLTFYQENIRNLRENDVLLSSPRIYAMVKEALSGGRLTFKKTSQETCSILHRELDKALRQDMHDHKRAREKIEAKLKEPNWINDTNFKTQIWSSSGRKHYVDSLKGDFNFNQSTVCRMESRYGEGADQKNRVTNILMLGTIPVSMALRLPAELMSLVYAKRAKTAYSLARAMTVAELTLGTGLVVHGIKEACQEKLAAISGDKSCEVIQDSERKSLFYKQQDARACLIAKGTGILFAGLASLGAKSLLASSKNQDVGRVLEARVAESQKIAESMTGKALLPTQTASNQSLSQLLPNEGGMLVPLAEQEARRWALKIQGLNGGGNSMQARALRKQMSTVGIEKSEQLMGRLDGHFSTHSLKFNLEGEKATRTLTYADDGDVITVAVDGKAVEMNSLNGFYVEARNLANPDRLERGIISSIANDKVYAISSDGQKISFPIEEIPTHQFKISSQVSPSWSAVRALEDVNDAKNRVRIAIDLTTREEIALQVGQYVPKAVDSGKVLEGILSKRGPGENVAYSVYKPSKKVELGLIEGSQATTSAITSPKPSLDSVRVVLLTQAEIEQLPIGTRLLDMSGAVPREVVVGVDSIRSNWLLPIKSINPNIKFDRMPGGKIKSDSGPSDSRTTIYGMSPDQIPRATSLPSESYDHVRREIEALKNAYDKVYPPKKAIENP